MIRYLQRDRRAQAAATPTPAVMTTPASPKLSAASRAPVEIWAKIFSYRAKSHELTHQWFTCRQVSRTVREAVELNFASRHIKDVNILFNWNFTTNAGRYSDEPDFVMDFNRFSDDKKLAVFRWDRAGKYKENDDDDEEADGADSDEEDAIQAARDNDTVALHSWQDGLWEYMEPKSGGGKCAPPYLIITGGCLVNDTELPSLSYDYEEREISFDWRALFTLFFREDVFREKYMQRWVAGPGKASALGMRSATENGEMDFESALKQTMQKYANTLDEAVKAARRKRIIDWYRDNTNFETPWKEDDIDEEYEKKKLKAMKEAAFVLQFEDLSDGEGEEEDEEDEEDEWEDGSEDGDDVEEDDDDASAEGDMPNQH